MKFYHLKKKEKNSYIDLKVLKYWLADPLKKQTNKKHDMRHVAESEHSPENFSSLALKVWVSWCIEGVEEKDDWLTKSLK